MQNPTLIFIPDISGFTEFVNHTAIDHSQHIISELLENIIDSNQLEMSISEIEGDAVLFYKNHSIPNTDEIIQQSKNMFLRFHSYLSEIEKTNVCQCGACQSASNLSIKFITHLGDTKKVIVKNFSKLIGSDLILAHRLLKNSIHSIEYLLLTDQFLNNDSANLSNINENEWIKIETSLEEFDSFGSISLKYIDLNPLRSELSSFIKENRPKKIDKKADVFVKIKAPLLLVHHALTNADSKYDYVPGIKKILKDSKINKVNSSHTCVFDNLEIHFVTKSNTVNKNDIAYSEEAKLASGFKFITDYRLQEINGITELSIYTNKIEEKNSPQSIFKKMKDYIFLKFLIYNTKRGMKHFKNYCEILSKENKWK